MNFAISLVVLLFCGLIVAENNGDVPETEETEIQSHFPAMGELLNQLGAMRDKLQAVETRLKDTENQFLKLRNKEATKVIFSTVLGHGNIRVGPFNTDTTLIYKRVIINTGNAYSPHTGVFTAPVAGVYYFSIFYHAEGEHFAMLVLYKNDQVTISTSDHKSEADTADNGGNAVFLQLQRGDQVYVRLPAGKQVWGSNFHTTFSGFLVTQM